MNDRLVTEYDFAKLRIQMLLDRHEVINMLNQSAKVIASMGAAITALKAADDAEYEKAIDKAFKDQMELGQSIDLFARTRIHEVV